MKLEIELSFATDQRRHWKKWELLSEKAAFSFAADLKTQGRAP